MSSYRYKCLVDATAPNGYTLPPIKANTDVAVELYGNGDRIEFSYQDKDGRRQSVQAVDIFVKEENRHYFEFETGYGLKPDMFSKVTETPTIEVIHAGAEDSADMKSFRAMQGAFKCLDQAIF